MTNPIIRKVQKLLALAADQTGKPEGLLAAEKAEAMMKAHAIKMEDLTLAEQVEVDPIGKHRYDLPSSAWLRTLFHTLAEHCNATSAYSAYKMQVWDAKAGKYKSKSVQRVTVYGHQSDVEVAKYLFDLCKPQLETEWKTYRKEYIASAGHGPQPWHQPAGYEHAGTTRADFLVTACWGLASKLRTIREGEQDVGTALMVNRKARVTDWMSENVKLGKAKGRKVRHSNEGWAAGGRVSIRAGVEGTSTKRLA